MMTSITDARNVLRMAEIASKHVHAVDPDGVEEKGLRAGTLGLMGATVIGLASTAPVYSLAATIGLVVAAVGVYAPAFMLIAFVPMLLTAFAYRELNNVIPDCGTVFTWGTKAFGPHLGWMGGWAVAVTGTIFLGSAAQVTGTYLFDLIGADSLVNSKLAVAAVGCAFIVLMTYIAYRGLEIAAWMQTVLVALQYIALAMLSIACLYAVFSGNGSEGSLTPEWNWLNPFNVDFSSFVQAFLLCLFIYWGWDAILAVNEETKDPEKTPGRAALIATVVLLVGYTVVTISTVSYAGVGEEGIGLANPAIQDDIFNAIALPLVGQWGTAFILLVTLISTAASAQTTILPTARGTLSMAVYKALPSKFAQVNPKFMTPGFSTFVTCTIGLTFYVIMTFVSDNILQDTISSISLSIAFYYALTAFACAWYFRKEAFSSARSFFMMFLFPLIGGLILILIFIFSAYYMWNPDYGNSSLWGVGTVFIIGVGSLAVGVVLMLLWQMKAPAFFRGETLKHDTPVLAPDE